jgi:hypothetical protein
MPATVVRHDVRDAKAHLTHLIERVERGGINRTAIGFLAGQVDLSGDWDSPRTNAEAAADYAIGGE